ncbi:MAG TPA: rhomboid family intramembrane serine protease [Polyangiaceae bacterium]|jgi:membrane associated rhomboid family serine protease
MNAPPGLSIAFPKPRRALWIVLVAMTALGIFTAFLSTWVPGGRLVFQVLGFELYHLAQPWRFLTSGLLTDPEHWSHLGLSLLGLYFLGAPLEQRWGSWRFARFLALSTIVGNLTVLAIAAIVPADAQARFHPEFVFGPTAAIIAVAIAWSREYAQSTVNLFFFLPVRGKVLFWITIGFCVLDLIYPSAIPEGVVAPFGGVIAGLLWGGTPSLARTAWLRVRLAVLRRQSSSLTVDDVLQTKPKRRPRAGGPPLRVVPGGLEEVLKKRTPPKDKRYLN